MRRGLGIALPKTRSQLRDRQLQVGADASHLPIIERQSEVPGAITISVAPLKRADNAQLPGFKITRAGMPDPINRL